VIVDVGDTLPLSWTPAGGVDAVVVTASLTGPDGSSSALTVTHASTGTYMVAAAFPVAGDWRVVWTSASPNETFVVGVAALPPAETAVWAPDLRKVGSHIPSRTRDVESNEPLGTFTATTYPDADQVGLVIGSAVSVVAGFVGRPVVAAAYPLCETAAALWAAYWVEIGWPGRDGDVSVFDRLRADALLLMGQAKAVNVGAGGGTEDIPDTDGRPDNLPLWSFPPPVRIVL
jgi:hypothetical protein